MKKAEVLGLYNDALGKLKEQIGSSSSSSSLCSNAILIALEDSGVQEEFFKNFLDGHKFNGIRCLNNIGLPEEVGVYYDFSCASGTMCFIKPDFVAFVSIKSQSVTNIASPYGLSQENGYVGSSNIDETGVNTLRTFGSSGGIQFINPRLKDGKVCVTVSAWAKIEIGWPINDDVEFNIKEDVCVALDTCYTLLDIGIGKVEVCYKAPNKICATAEIGKWGIGDSWKKCIEL